MSGIGYSVSVYVQTWRKFTTFSTMESEMCCGVGDGDSFCFPFGDTKYGDKSDGTEVKFKIASCLAFEPILCLNSLLTRFNHFVNK